MTDPDVAELRMATERLVEQVAALSLALQTVNHLQARQLATERKADDAARAAVDTRAEVSQSFEDLETRTTAARAVAQRRLRIFAISTSLVALLVALVAVYLVHRVEQREVSGLHNQRLALCAQRNADAVKSARDTQRYFAPKLAQEEASAHPDPVLISILQALAQTKAQTVVCN